MQTLHHNASVLITAPNHLRSLVQRNRYQLSSIHVSILSRTSRLTSLNFLPTSGQLLSRAHHSNRHLLFSTALSNTINILIHGCLHSPTARRISTTSTPIPSVDRRVLAIHSTSGRRIILRLISNRNHALTFAHAGRNTGGLTGRLATTNVPTISLRNGLSRTTHGHGLTTFDANRIQILITASVTTHNVRISSVSVIIRISPTTRRGACLRHYNHATHTNTRNGTVSINAPSRHHSIAHVLHVTRIGPSAIRIRPKRTTVARLIKPTTRGGRAPIFARPRPGPHPTHGRKRAQRRNRTHQSGDQSHHHTT